MDSVNLLFWLQNHLGFMDEYLRRVSQFGFSHFFLLTAALIYWTGYKAAAARLAVGMTVSTLTFGVCRQFFPSPRPYWIYPELFNGIQEKAYGMPSGHTQNATVFWGLLAYSIKRPWFWLIALLMVLSAAISRQYLGLHFPNQILAGFLVGCAVFIAITGFEQPVVRYLQSKSLWQSCLIVLAASFIPALICLFFREIIEWGQGNGSSQPYAKLFKYSGVTAGLWLGILLSPKFSAPSIKLFITQAFPGAVSVILLWQLLPFFPAFKECHELSYLARWSEGFLVMIWATAIWPRVHQLLFKV